VVINKKNQKNNGLNQIIIGEGKIIIISISKKIKIKQSLKNWSLKGFRVNDIESNPHSNIEFLFSINFIFRSMKKDNINNNIVIIKDKIKKLIILFI